MYPTLGSLASLRSGLRRGASLPLIESCFKTFASSMSGPLDSAQQTPYKFSRYNV